MSVTTETRQRVFAIRELVSLGYKDKQVCMIVRAKQPYVSKVRSGNMHATTMLEEGEKFEFTKQQIKRREALDKILTLPDFVSSGAGIEEDALYIQVLKFFLADREEVYTKLYFHLSKKHYGRMWAASDIDIRMFDAETIGIDHFIFLDLIIDYFL